MGNEKREWDHMSHVAYAHIDRCKYEQDKAKSLARKKLLI